MTLSSRIDQIYIGQLQQIGPSQTPTGIFKSAYNEPVLLTPEGLEGDIQVDRRVHGGPEKALYHFPAENYALLKQALPHLEASFIPGSIGENISSHGLTDETVHIGDIFRIGSALVQVSQPRRPCWKVNHKYGNGHIAALLMSQGISGWYYRVLEPDTLTNNDPITLIERLPDSISVAEIWQRFVERLQKRLPVEAINRDIPGLSDEWKFE
ncbi:MOSC domain-containing protein [Neptuniibacter sp. CAU 1671]|uniref:MOSC domain-containing protein n=1 Tax=Neptuniibacter sp. CAU 1671 TaxID=3032593 RepID=UPI0023DB64C3|nr:MOSC domain-containing protein [Neptuniibacter sp. CAU 1671]MDF2182513.1 MOSC domain-containing protein [Neptuniibacter sp. CAU 1671]